MKLRDVLTAFEENGSMSLAQMARHYEVDPRLLEEMIQYWVRKGRLRDAAAITGCNGCPVAGTSCNGCTLTTAPTPPQGHRYEKIELSMERG
jgi:hypothetical protein